MTDHIIILKETLENLIIFLDQFQWLHNFPMIKIFGNESAINTLMTKWQDWEGWYRSIPDKEEAMNFLLTDSTESIVDCPSLRKFLSDAKKYSIPALLETREFLSYESVVFDFLRTNQSERSMAVGRVSSREWEKDPDSTCLGKDDVFWKRLKKSTPKKKYEIQRLSRFLNTHKGVSQNQKILDIGSGLGLLDLYLHANYEYKVIGVEGLAEKIKRAQQRKEEKIGKACPDVSFILWHIEDDENTIKKSKEITSDLAAASLHCSCKLKLENIPNSSIGVDLISLHSCGDLSPIMLKMFTSDDNFASILMISCCYHKMSPSLSSSRKESDPSFKTCDQFKNFPLSECLKELKHANKLQINTYGLRLASEESLAHWLNRSAISQEVQSIAFRAILQNVCDKHGIKLKKRRRHCTTKSSFNSFEAYIESSTKDFEFISEDATCTPDLELLKHKLLVEHAKQEKKVELVGLVRALQLVLQPVIESLIILDRLIYLKEKGFSHSGVIQLFNEIQSPRNKALFAFRHRTNFE